MIVVRAKDSNCHGDKFPKKLVFPQPNRQQPRHKEVLPIKYICLYIIVNLYINGCSKINVSILCIILINFITQVKNAWSVNLDDDPESLRIPTHPTLTKRIKIASTLSRRRRAPLFGTGSFTLTLRKHRTVSMIRWRSTMVMKLATTQLFTVVVKCYKIFSTWLVTKWWCDLFRTDKRRDGDSSFFGMRYQHHQSIQVVDYWSEN